MAYTVNKLAKLSGVSVRTLHFYDEIGLLKPAYYGDNSYRYYEEEQLLMLQQILFFREMDIPLNEIQKIISSNDFDIIDTLKSHKLILQKNLDRTKSLIETIDKTILRLRGKEQMKDEELYYGFDSEKQKNYEKELIDTGVVTQEWMSEYKDKRKHWNKADHEKFMNDGKSINDELISAIDKKLKPDSAKVQDIIRKHHAWVGWNPTKEKYIGLAEMYETMDYKNFYNSLDTRLLKFIVTAMRIFAERNLS